ncbi:hypothetical protein EJ05DRAFT_475201 [Pseudovirgaria hyperparasitica]|uniref:Uncharacterized protein n=1 Tax=Pseudovirgaria hyperparasitica TaxID=470096 RepID=A0A6A6W7T7_9PEZI|nr:uncharacterized protein EJ05DRAFT_475201 [Pseudovirgaria hyperparasitica]KAF2758958.1 hypothetical protein EJ05DRAFT_475201 [Pseudovirgaria hyperparasitica]
MEDDVRISDERFKSLYETSFRSWASLYSRAKENLHLPTNLFNEHTFSQHPYFPENLRLKHEGSEVLVSGHSVWSSTAVACENPTGPFQQLLQFVVTSNDPILLSIVDSTQGNSNYAQYFDNEGDFLAVLVLAWAYILSARWAEMMPESCSIRYTECRAIMCDTSEPGIDPNTISVDIGPASSEERRWWTAVLAPDQGWQATMKLEQETFLSPWSVRLQSDLHFSIQQKPSSPRCLSPSSSEALGYLDKFCTRHNIVDQSYAALAAALLLPSMGRMNAIRLHAPRANPYKHCVSSERNLQHSRICEDHYLDRLLTMSCNPKGIRSMLLSAFFEPSIECNAVTPWLQGALCAIETLTRDTPFILGRMCMERAPRLAILWLGSTILGLNVRLLQDVRTGMIPIDLHSAVWSDTVQSFIQLPTSNPVERGGFVTRADECRLLLLSQQGYHARVPFCQWKPFGETALDDVDIEVRLHAKCGSHGLQYQSFVWECTDENLSCKSSRQTDVPPPADLPGLDICSTNDISISYNALDRDKEFVSENETRKIFTWLRSEGYTRSEKGIWEHEWLAESDDEDTSVLEDENGSCAKYRDKSMSRVESWSADCEDQIN